MKITKIADNKFPTRQDAQDNLMSSILTGKVLTPEAQHMKALLAIYFKDSGLSLLDSIKKTREEKGVDLETAIRIIYEKSGL